MGWGYGMAARCRTLPYVYGAVDLRYQGTERSDNLGVPGHPGDLRAGVPFERRSTLYLPSLLSPQTNQPTDTTHRTHPHCQPASRQTYLFFGRMRRT